MAPFDAHRHAPRLGRHPEVGSLSVGELVDAVRDGSVRVRSRGTRARWSDEDRRALLDSIERGFPIGTLTFERRPAPGGRVRVGGLAFDVGPRADALQVIDGHERIVALVEALWSPTDALALEAAERAWEYRVATCTVDVHDAEARRAVFARANVAGVPPTDFDVFEVRDASTGAMTVPSDVAAAVASMGWPRPSDETVLEVIGALEGSAPASDVVPRAGRALIAAVDFLAERAALPRECGGTATPLIAPLARFFDAFASPSVRSLVLLRRWLWRSLAYASTARAFDEPWRRLDAIVPGDEHGSVQRLLATAPTTPPAASSSSDALFARMAEWGADDSPPLAAIAPEDD